MHASQHNTSPLSLHTTTCATASSIHHGTNGLITRHQDKSAEGFHLGTEGGRAWLPAKLLVRRWRWTGVGIVVDVCCRSSQQVVSSGDVQFRSNTLLNTWPASRNTTQHHTTSLIAGKSLSEISGILQRGVGSRGVGSRGRAMGEIATESLI